jgi:prepilin-type N-terminal cleavage/methylation domain-containing protein
MGAGGFTLIEMLIAIVILTFGLLTTGQLMYSTLSAASLSRSTQSAALIAQSKLESLSFTFAERANAPALKEGEHGPEEVEIMNHTENIALNRFQIRWKSSDLIDPRTGRKLKAKRVTVTVTPIGNTGRPNLRPSQNKTVSIAAVFSPMAPAPRWR